jgi:hypothetical protein
MIFLLRCIMLFPATLYQGTHCNSNSRKRKHQHTLSLGDGERRRAAAIFQDLLTPAHLSQDPSIQFTLVTVLLPSWVGSSVTS